VSRPPPRTLDFAGPMTPATRAKPARPAESSRGFEPAIEKTRPLPAWTFLLCGKDPSVHVLAFPNLELYPCFVDSRSRRRPRGAWDQDNGVPGSP
jgi:hypothetical protein